MANECVNCVYKNEFSCMAPGWFCRLCGISEVPLATRVEVPEACPPWLIDADKRLRERE